MTRLYMTVNPRQPNTLPRNTIKNPNNYGHCMAVTTREGKQTIDPPISSTVDVYTIKDDDEFEVSGESKNATEKEAVVTKKDVLIPRTPPPFPHRLV